MGAAESGAEQDARPTLADVYRTHYPTLFRLAALLTGDTGTAEAVVLDCSLSSARGKPCGPAKAHSAACDGRW